MEKNEKPFIIPIFLPHAACPNRCLFCNQTALHAEKNFLNFTAMKKEIRRWKDFRKDGTRHLEVAFYGGNFLGLSGDIIEECILFLEKEIREARIRFSTRPDSISERSLSPFIRKKMKPVVELGIQSLDEAVLAKNLRNHTTDAVFRAIPLLVEIKADIIAQMMLGLPGADKNSDFASAKKLSLLPIRGARLAPTLVLEGSGLAVLYRKGLYTPLSLESAVKDCAEYAEILETAGIPVIRFGLQTDDFLEKSILAGPHHPAFGEYVRGFQLKNAVLSALEKMKPFDEEESICIRVCQKLSGRMRGMGKNNETFFSKTVLPAKVSIVTDRKLRPGSWHLERKNSVVPKR